MVNAGFLIAQQQGDRAGVIGGLILILGLVQVLGSFGGSVMLRAAVSMANWFLNLLTAKPKTSKKKKKPVGRSRPSEEFIPEPSFLYGTVICFLTTLVANAGQFAAALGTKSLTGGAAFGILMLVSFLCMCVMLTMFLPTSFDYAILVTVCFYLVVALITAILAGVVYAVWQR